MKKEWKFAFEKTIPVLAGYLSIGIAFGLLMQNMGYNVFWALLISLILYAGSMQFVLLQFLTGGTSLITVAIMTLLVNSRHLFYGLITFDTTGIDFAMTALFTVIFIEQWKGTKSHIPALTGLITGVGCLLVFGPNNFILPTLLISVAVLMALKSRVLAKEQEE